jgi:NTE family protein
MNTDMRTPRGGAARSRPGLLLAGLVVTLTGVAATAVARPEQASAPTAEQRPRIGLVLGGGGAKGAAHLGVLAVLDEMRIPVDCVVGTSMGALVGGIFATGQTATEIQAAVGEISWSETIAFAGRRKKEPMHRKLAGVTYSNSLEFGWGEGRLQTPRGFVDAQRIEQTIGSLVWSGQGVEDFDQLPIPFRAIATDMQTGEMVVLSSGDLALAMRASMAVPGIFAPVTLDGRILGDGGLSRNLGVDVARQTCADVVIAVAVPTPQPTAEQLQSPLSMMGRTIEVLIGANEKQQLETLTDEDVRIVVQVGDIGTGSFDKVQQAVPLGRAAAEAARDSLRRYALSPEQYLAWRGGLARGSGASPRLAGLNVHGLERVSEDYVRATLGLNEGDEVGSRQVANRVDGLYALGDFESVKYRFSGGSEAAMLDLHFAEKSWGPNFLRFDLGLQMASAGDTAFVLGGDYRRTWVNSRGGELQGLLQLGRTSAGEFALYQPLDERQRWFVEPGIRGQRSLEDFYLDGDAVMRYNFSELYGYLEAGRVVSTTDELRLGLRSGVQSAKRDIANPGFPEISSEGYGGWTLQYTHDSRDRAALPTSGWLARLRYYQSVGALAAEADYDRLEGLLAVALPVGADVIYLQAAGGGSSDGELPPYDVFTLGGPNSIPGLSLGELRGDAYWLGSAAYLRKVADISNLYGQSLYLGLRLTAADMSGRLDGIRSAPVYSAAVLLGGRTPLGPLSLSFGVTSTDEWRLVLGLGRPIEERNILDPGW